MTFKVRLSLIPALFHDETYIPGVMPREAKLCPENVMDPVRAEPDT